MGERARISYFFQLHPNSCERRRKIASPMKLFWKRVFGKKKKKKDNKTSKKLFKKCKKSS
jgi:hypothetical protein